MNHVRANLTDMKLIHDEPPSLASCTHCSVSEDECSRRANRPFTSFQATSISAMNHLKKTIVLPAVTVVFVTALLSQCWADYETSFFTLELDPLVKQSLHTERCQECGSFHSTKITSALPMLNAQRKRGGIPALKHAPDLEKVAKKRLELIVASGQKGHPPGSFAPGKYEGVGWISGHSPKRVSACYSMDPNVREAGAVMLHVKDGVHFVVVYR